MLNRLVLITHASYGDCRCRKTQKTAIIGVSYNSLLDCASSGRSLLSPTKAGQTQLLAARLHKTPIPSKTA